MRRFLPLLALLAWVLLQVPCVVCTSDCASTTTSAVLLELHSCHDEASVAHTSCCGGHAPAPDAEDTASETSEGDTPDEGTHVLVRIETPSAGQPTSLPAPAQADDVFGPAQDGAGTEPAYGLFRDLTRHVGLDAPPTPLVDPVSAGTLLQV